MTLTPRFHVLAGQELNEAALFYSKARPGLGRAFVNAVEEGVRFLCDSPSIGQAVDGDIRWWLVRRFPYCLYYRVQLDELRILAVGHQKRRPFYWRGRSQ